MLQIFQNLGKEGKVGKMSEKAQNVFSAIYATPIWDILAKMSSLAKIWTNGAHISQEFIIHFIKNLLKNTTLWGDSNVW